MSNNGKFDRSISMLCPTCGSTQFDLGENEASEHITCAMCGLKLTKGELRQANDEHIAAHVEQIKHEVVNDFRDQLKRAFKGNKAFRMR